MHFVSDSGPFDDDDTPEGFDFNNLFGSGDPQQMMSGFMQLFGGMGGGGGFGGLGNALQVAMSIASGGTSEPNVDPMDRLALEQLVRVAELHVGNATGLRTSTGSPLTIVPVTRSEWVQKSMEAYKPVLEQLAAAMASPDLGDEFGSDPQMAMFQQLFASIRPMMVNMTTGSMIGHVGNRAIGTYDLPIPRPGSDELLVVMPNLEAFGEEWSLDKEELRMWIALSEVAHHAVLSIPHVAQRVSSLLGSYTNAFRNNTESIGDALEGFQPSGDMTDIAGLQQQLQEMFGDPSALLGSMRSPEQEAMLPEISALLGAIVGYIDHIMDQVGDSLISSYSQLTEALRRRRVTASSSDRFVEKLLGLELDRELYDKGRAFIDGIVDRAGDDALGQLWADRASLPTPNEIAAPGLWLSRMGIDFDVDIDPAELAALDDFLDNQTGEEE